MRKLDVFLIASLVIILLSLSSCLVESTPVGAEGGTTAVVDPNESPENQTRLICDPFDTNNQMARDRGLFGNIYYLNSDNGQIKNVEEYIQQGELINANIYLDRLFVQTQPFEKGIIDNSGNTLELNGHKFYKDFAIEVNAQLQLGSHEEAGYYQLALISDDGALLKRIDENNNEVILVNNNGSHPTKMACAEEPVYMDHNTKLQIRMQQFQGPRKNISMVALWRPYDPNNNEAENHCGKGGNGYFFDSTKTPIKPKKQFYDLLVNNWKVLENENFEFPNQEQNPCAPEEETLLLTGFSITGVGRNFVRAAWLSNIPASSQLEIKNVSTGAIITSGIDTNQVLNHDMTQLGLSPNTLYSVRAISNTVGGQTVMTDERAFRTPR